MGKSEVLASIGQGVAAIAVVNCNFTYYNVTLQYDDTESYSIIDEVTTDRFLSDGFSGPVRTAVLTSNFMETLQSDLLLARSTTDKSRLASISERFTSLALGSASIFADTTSPALLQQQIQLRILGQYPITPVVLLVSVLFLNSLFALVICVATSFSRTDTIRVPGKTGPKRVPIWI